jgi:glucose-6-phosphate dehydrogenase assembly protein OpcA
MTATPSAPIVPTNGAGLSSEAIERTLRGLWREMEDAGTEVTQVRMLNLIVYLPESPSPEVRSAIGTVALQHPGRTIILLEDVGPPHAEATIVCRVGDHARHACGEQITLYGAQGGHALHSLAVALVQAGLPVTLWWHGPVDFENHVFEKLLEIADHVILDSRTWPDSLPFLPRLAEAIAKQGRNRRLSDLQWVELTPWRRLIAHAFDVPAAREALPRLDELVIEYGGSGRLSVAALLLAGWLASRLGWEVGDAPYVHDDTGYVLPLRRHESPGDGGLMVALRRRDTPESICAVEMRTGGERPARFYFDISQDALRVETHIELAGSSPLVQVSHLQRREPAQLLSEELALNTGDPVYIAALASAIRLGQSLERIK